MRAFLEKFGRYRRAQTEINFRLRCGVGNVPTFGFRFSAQIGGHILGRMHLKRQFVLAIEQLNEKRESVERYEPHRISQVEDLSTNHATIFPPADQY